MVAIRYITAIIALFTCAVASGQGRTVIAGLEEHTEYRGLVEEERALVRMSDSISRSVGELRRSLRTDTLARAAISADILRMEQESFEVRNRMARLASRINTIEQEWILENLYAGTPGGKEGKADEVPQYLPANLVYSSYFEQGLSPGELADLRRAQLAERDLPPLVARYRENHALIRSLAEEYGRAATQAAADSIMAGFEALARTNATLEGIIGGRWGVIFDDKSYLYNLLADKDNRTGMLVHFEEGMERLRTQQAGWHGVYASDAIIDHVLQKRLLTDYEITLAGELGNGAAADSLRRVAAAIPRPEDLEGLEPVRLKERLFLDYTDVTIGSSPYNAQNPIPEVTVYPRGIIYRVLVGDFSSAQAPSVFRGASPLAVDKSGGRFRYFAGGFPTEGAAVAAVEQLRRAGFRNPVPAAWMDGTYIDPAAGDEGQFYRIEVAGTGELSAGVREIIGDATGSGGNAAGDIVRRENGFIVTPLDAAAAMRLRAALEAFDPETEVKLSKIPE